jgi:hypothetical protein
MTTKPHRPVSRRRRRTRRGKTLSPRSLPVGITLYYYPSTKKMAPAIYDAELQCLAGPCLARIRTILALRGSPTVIGIVLFDERQQEGFWLGEDD